jgi:hypothetical protein
LENNCERNNRRRRIVETFGECRDHRKRKNVLFIFALLGSQRPLPVILIVVTDRAVCANSCCCLLLASFLASFLLLPTTRVNTSYKSHDTSTLLPRSFICVPLSRRIMYSDLQSIAPEQYMKQITKRITDLHAVSVSIFFSVLYLYASFSLLNEISS